MKKSILMAIACSGLWLLAVSGYAQQLGGASADAKMLPDATNGGSGLGGLYTPNLYDGSADINIPIYQYGTDDGNFGVSLSYNTKGVKVDEPSNNIGSHWNLAVGASVQRIVKDIPDELNRNQGATIEAYTPYLAFKGRLAASYGTQPSTTYQDKESDDFMVSLGGLSFSFNIGKGRAIFLNPDKRIRVELLYGGMNLDSLVTATGSFPATGVASIYATGGLEFRITDPGGNKYYFVMGQLVNQRIGSDYNNCGRIANAVTGDYAVTQLWRIKEVTLASGAVIRYNYSDMMEQGTYNVLYRNIQVQETAPYASSADVPPYRYANRLQSIEYPNGVSVTMVYDDNTTRCDMSYSAGTHPFSVLRRIQVGSAFNTIQYVMDQNYWVSAIPGSGATETPYGTCVNGSYTHAGTLRHRLKLNGINITSGDNSVTEPYYSFEYNTTPLPIRGGGGQDYFGFYNGKQATTYSNTGAGGDQDLLEKAMNIPYHNRMYPDYSGYGLDKAEDTFYMQACILKKIKNAYGGEASFTYEGHVLDTALTGIPLPLTDPLFFGLKANDGLRLQSVKEKEQFHSDYRLTTFQYERGQRFLSGGYFHTPAKMAGSTGSTLSDIAIGGQYMSPHHLVGVSNHGYGKVTVTSKANGSIQLSRKVIFFSNFKDSLSGNKPRYQVFGKHYFELPYTDKQYIRDWELGLPLTIVEYDQNDRITLRTDNKYAFSIDSTDAVSMAIDNEKRFNVSYTGAPVIDTFVYPDTDPAETCFVTALRSFTDTYHPYRGKAQLRSTVIRKYVKDNSFVYDSTAYAYDSRNNLDYIITRNSTGDFVKTDQVYNYDMPGPGTAFNMSAAGLEKLTGTERWLMASGGDPDLLLDATINSYTYSGGLLQPQNLYQLQASDLLSYNTLTGYSGGGTPAYFHGYMNAAYNGSAINYFKKISEVTARDANGNPLETYIPATGQYKAMIWDLNNNRKLAEAGSCRYEDIAYSSFEEVVPPSPNTIRGNLEYSTLGVQTYTVLGERAPTGNMVYRLHDGILPTSLATAMPLQVDTYLLSFWYTSTGSLTAMPFIDVAGTPHFFSSEEEVATRGSWKQYQIRVTPATPGPLTIMAGSSTDILIDEVRLFPLVALMQSQVGEPMFGTTSTTDAGGRITYYEYDKLGRKTVVRDQDGNILSRTKNVVLGSD